MMAVLSDELEQTKARFEHWRAVQKETIDRNGAGPEKMAAERRRFSGLGQLKVDPGIYLESVIDGNDLMPVRYFEMGTLAGRAIGRIHFDLGPRVGQGYATGFLVAPGLLLTNSHVLPSLEVALAASVTFDAEDGLDGLPKPPQVFKLIPRSGFLTDPELDFCFVAVSPTSTQGRVLDEFGYLRLHQGTGKILREEYATIIQHPRGRQKQVAARNNKVIVYVYDDDLSAAQKRANNYIYYQTDTLPGSSGAPVLSDEWYVVALHRRGVPINEGAARGPVRPAAGAASVHGDPPPGVEFYANEGVRVSRVMRRLRELAESGPRGRVGLTAAQIIARIEATTSDRDSGPFAAPSAAINRLSNPSAGQPAPGAAPSATDPASQAGSLADARLMVPGADAARDGDILELTRRSGAAFANAPGFDEDFLGVSVGLPQLSPALKKAAALRNDTDEPDYVLPFMHFSVVMHAQRRLPIFAAVNIHGGKINASSKPARPAWSYDPRIDETQQPDDSIFSSMVQRGHMGAREFMWWGSDAEALLADRHSFTLSNVCPQIDKFNGSKEWFQLERRIVAAAKTRKCPVNCFMGPVFSASDQLYDDLRGKKSEAEWDTGIRVPRRFWYVLSWREKTASGKQGKPKTRCFILDQGDDIEAAGPLEFDFERPATVHEVSLAEVKKLSKLEFPGLK